MSKKTIYINKSKLNKTLLLFSLSFIVVFFLNHFGKFEYENQLNEEASNRQFLHSLEELENFNKYSNYIVQPFSSSFFDYEVTKITYKTVWGFPVSINYNPPKYWGGFGKAYKIYEKKNDELPSIDDLHKEMNYFDKILFYLLSTIYNIYYVIFLTLFLVGINHLHNKYKVILK